MLKPEVKRKMAAWIILVIGLFAMVSGTWLIVKNWRIASWPTAPGRVTERGVGHSEHAVATGPPAFRFEAKVTYVYEVNGKEHEGHALRPSTRLGEEADARAEAEAVPDLVTVHYNPDDPTEAYLFTDSWVYPILVFAGGLIMTAAAGLWLLGASTKPE